MVKKSLLWFYRVTLATLWLIIIVLALSVLSMRYVVLPHIDDYKDRIAQRVSTVAKQKVTIGEIRASWHGLYPHLSLFKVDIYDAQNRPALTLDHIEASLSWLSLLILEPRFASIAVYKPALTVRREANGTVYVAGIAMGGPARPQFPNWALQQSQIDIVDAVVLWQDDMRKAPPLTLNQLNLQLISPAWEGLLGHHRFALKATPSAGSSYPIDIRGDVYGKDVAKPADWSGTLYARLEGTDIAAWRNWISYPVDLRTGFGAARAWVEFADGKLEAVTGDVLLSNVRTRLPKASTEAVLNSLSGRLRWKQRSDGQEISAEQLKIVTADGLHMQNGQLAMRERLINGKQSLEGNVKLDEIKLDSLHAFASLFPIPRQSLQTYAELAPTGVLRNLQLRWKGNQSTPVEYGFRTDFSGLGIQPYKQVPGFSNLSGSIDADQSNGTLTLNSRQATLNFEKVMRWPIPADRLAGHVTWNQGKNGTEVQASNVAIVNAHLSGTINARYLHNGIKGGYLDLKGKFANADAKFARFYFPTILGEHTLHWLDTSILDGRGEDVNVTVKGYLREFPYPGNELGQFKVTAKVSDGVLHFAQDWPQIDGVKLDLLFEGNRMELNASAGNTAGNKITKARISIPELHVAQPVLDIVGEGQGLVSDGINYVNSSPIHRLTQGFTDTLKTTGNGKLNLELHIPLHDTEATKVKGSYLVSNGSMAGDGFPELSRINGKLEFTESSLRAQNATTWVYGGPAAFNLISGKDHVMRIAARGRVTDAGIRQALGTGLWDRLSGSAEWLGAISIVDKQLDISINSNLLGMASTLPAPLGKAAGDSLMLRFDKKHASASQDTITASIGNVLGAKLQRSGTPGQLTLERGEIGLNVMPELPAQPGLALRGSMDYLDFDEWQSLLSSTQKSLSANSGDSASTASAPVLSRVDLSVNTLDVMDRRINALKLSAKPASDGWQANIQSREINGDAQWHNAKAGANGNPGDNGKLSAKLKTLIIPSAVPNTAELRTQGNFKQQQADSYPALDITADNFEFGKKKLGRLELQASEQNEDWSIEKLRIINPESTLSAEGEWHNWKRNPNTRMTINWDIHDLGKTLERFGYPDTVKGGEADLTGQLKWPGSPHEFDFPGLSGNLQIDARKGQILKIRPGVGRLFSVLSLQNLPRRLTFDFRDVFSSGFTFDKVNVSVRIDKGIMRSDDFKMEGPVARVEMSGETDLQKETQHLNVKVTPYISDSLSLAALAGGPVVGAAAYIAQKLLKDPLNKLAADEYEIGGTWDNPQELKTPSAKPVTPGTTPLGK